ncbi:MAG: dihydrofolate reductase [Rickettsiales bacterium]|nr:dihydrofolate reductase [Rickettsiales bacterium]
MKKIALIVAHDLNKGIGKDNDLVWHCPEDMAHFKSITTKTLSSNKKNLVLMGRKTWESIPEKFKPLPNRINMVLTRDKNAFFHPDVIVVNSIENALETYDRLYSSGAVEAFYCIGGSQLYKTMISSPSVTQLHITLIHSSFDVDCYFPEYKQHYQIQTKGDILESKSVKYQFFTYSKSTQN